MYQSLGSSDPLLRVKHQHPLEQVHGVGLHRLKALLEGHGVSVGQRGDKFQRILRAYGIYHVLGRRPQQVCDDRELVHVVLAGEKRLALYHLGEDASRRPNVHLDVVLLPCQHDLGRPVVPRRDIPGHLGVLDPRQAKITDLEIAILVYQDVAGLQVSVDHPRRVHVFEPPEDLVQEVLHELFLQRSSLQQPVQVCALQLCDEVNVFQGRKEDVLQANQVLVS